MVLSPAGHRDAADSGITAQLVAAAEKNWSRPCGNPLSKHGWEWLATDVPSRPGAD